MRTAGSSDLRRRPVRDGGPVSEQPSPRGGHRSPKKCSEDLRNEESEEDEVDDIEMDDKNIPEKKGLYPDLSHLEYNDQVHATNRTSTKKHVFISATEECKESGSSSSKSQSVTSNVYSSCKVLCIVAVIIIIIFGLPSILFFYPNSKTVESSPKFGVSEIVDKLQTDFQNQPRLSFKIIKSALNKVMVSQNESQPEAPAVLLLISARGANVLTTCFAKQLARLVASGDGNYQTIHGTNYHGKDPDNVKKEIDELLTDTLYNKEQTVVLIESLDTIPSQAAMMLHSYCDDQNAPYKNAVFIMTIDADTDISDNCDSQKFDEAADKHLKSVWSDLGKDKLMPLLSRITVSVAAIYRKSVPGFCN